MRLQDILKKALEQNASDIIITWWTHPCLKINWDVVYLNDEEIVSKDLSKELVFSIMTETQKQTFIKKLELDFSIELKWYSRFRVNTFVQKNGFWMVLRPIKKDIPDFESLWLPEQIKKVLNYRNWLVLITWSVWSWKTTTLASLINNINKNQRKHIITVEDPIEFIYENKLSVIEQREVWAHTLNFDNWLKYALRQAPDVIMIWEMRDLETFRLALRRAETWSLVFATLHTSWAARTVARVIDMFQADEKDKIRQQLSESLLWVVWQQLLKNKEETGRVVATEVLFNNTSIANMIRKNLTHQIQNAIETWKDYGMITMKDSLDDLYWKWLISEQTYDYQLNLLDRYK